MDFNALIAELRASSENLPKDSADRSLLSSVYCNKACTVLDHIAENTDYDNIITGLWLVAAHFAEQLSYLKPVPALSELCFKLFRQCAKAVLNIQWQNLEEDSSLRQNFLASLANLHAKLVPLDFPRFRLLEALTEKPWTNPTLAKVMGGEVEEKDEEVRCYIEQEDPIILQLRVDMMLKENCEEYALNLCNSCLSHPELQSDLGVRKTQLSLLYKLGQEDKLQEECQKLSIQDAVRIIKQLQTSKTHRQICTVLTQTFMVQNWIRPSDMEANKELLRLWIRHQLLVDREQDQFKESVWAMAKLSQSTEQIVIFIDVLREECGETFLQLYVDMCIFAINVDKGQMETNKKEGNLEAAAARRSDMASICAKLSCLCHHASVKVARICALTSFALKPSEQSFTKIGTFYGQGTDCCNKCGRDRNREPGTVNPATLYEVERLLNMLRPDYLSPDQSYINIQILCRRFLQESLKNAHLSQRKQFLPQNAPSLPSLDAIHVDGPGSKLTPVSSCRPTNVFEALSPQDFQNTQMLLNKMRLQNISSLKPSMPVSPASQHIYHSSTNRSPIVSPGQQSGFSPAGQRNKPQYMFDAEKVKSKQPYGVPLEQQHQYYLSKHEKELEQRRRNAQKKREEKTQQALNLNSQLLQQQQQQREQLLKQQHNEQVTQIIQTALKQDSNALQKLAQGASPGVVQTVLNIMKGTMLKQSSSSNQQHPISLQTKPLVSSSQHGTQPLPTVSTLLKPSLQTQQLQKHHEQHKQQELQQPRDHSPPRKHPKPQLYAQPIVVSTSSSAVPMKYHSPSVTMLNNRNQVTQSSAVSAASSSEEKQKAENFMLAKSHVEDTRQFMQTHMPCLQQKQIAEPRQMSGSTVTVTNMSAANSPSHASYNLANRPKTTVELAEQAALAKLQKQDHSKLSVYPQSQQSKNSNSQSFICQAGELFPKGNQQQFIPSTSRATAAQQPKPFLHLQQQSFNFQHSQSSCSAPPSSDELSGSIMGIDDTIIKELLQDSGILANTFPDIEVDTIAEDKSRKIPEFSSLPQSVTPLHSNQIPKSSKAQHYGYSTPPAPYTIQSTQAHSVAKQNIDSASYHHHSVSGINKYPQVHVSTVSASSLVSPSNLNKSLSQSAPNSFTGPSNQAPNSAQLWSNSKTSDPQRDNINVLPAKDIKQEVKPTVDQLREMMKKEDIQGEICMDAANNATYRCIICSFAFETLDYLREHVRNVCKPGLQSSSVYNTKIKQDRANSAKAGVETTTVFQCLRCFELCVSDAGIKQHRLTCKRVPTVPSDLKKEAPNNKPKTLPKPVVGKQSQKKEHQDNSYKVPDLPLPFPYPSLNAEAVLKSMSMAGSFISQGHNLSQALSSRPHPPAPSGNVTSKPTISAPPPITNVSTTTSTSNIKNVPVYTSSTSCNTNQAPTNTNSNINTISQNSISNSHISCSISSKDIASFSQAETQATDPIGPGVKLVKSNFNLPDAEKLTPKENSDMISPPRYTEITGSGGSKFYKCGICSQTLCSLESFLVHWQECAVKNKSLLRKLELKERESNAKPVTGEVLENLLQIIALVAVGNGNIPYTITSDPEWCDVDDLCSLKDPCQVIPLDGTGSGEDTSSFSWYETEDCDSQESMDDTDDDVGEEEEVVMKVDNVDEITDRNAVQEKDSDEGHEEDDSRIFKKSRRKILEDTEDEADSMSDNEQNYVSTREVPPQLRDRKTLKPIHSFINETFNSSFAKSTVKPVIAKLDEKLKEATRDEKTFSESEVESDGESLFCKVCQASYQTKRILLQHFAGKHLQPYTVKTVADSSSYFCHLCQKTFSTFMHYMQHVPNHSVTIYEKMKAFITNRKSAQRSERIASQRGLTKRNNVIPKTNKVLKSKRAATKSAVDHLNQQLLADKTQSVRERLRISKRKRSLQSTFTSSDDDYSSDASNNVVFKSNKSTEFENLSDEQKPITRSRNAMRQKSRSQHKDEDSSTQSSLDQSGEEIGRGPRLAQVRDDDYVLSEDFDSDAADTNTPPTTRSRKRFVQSLRFSHYKRTKISYDSEPSEDNVPDSKCNNKPSFDSHLSDSDENSNCSDLLFSECQNGKFVPSRNSRPEIHSSEYFNINECTQSRENGGELIPNHVLFLRSVTKQQKKWLVSCNLHPTVMLETLCLDNLETSFNHDIHTTEIIHDLQTPSSLDKHNVSVEEAPEDSSNSEVSTTEPVKTRNSSFLDSFLSYLNQYTSSEEDTQPGKKITDNGPHVEPSHKRSTRYHLSQISETSQNDGIPSCDSSTEMEGICETSTSNISSPDTGHSIFSKFPTRKCSVNLGQKLSLEDFKTIRNLSSQGRALAVDMPSVSVVQKERADTCKVSSNVLSKSAHLITDVKQMPIVCLERNDRIDMYASKPRVSAISDKKFSCKSVVSEPKKHRDGSKDSVHTNGQVKERIVLTITAESTRHLSEAVSDCAPPISAESVEVNPHLYNDQVQMKTAEDTSLLLSEHGMLHSKQEVTCSDLNFNKKITPSVSDKIFDVAVLSPKRGDVENLGSFVIACSGHDGKKCEEKNPNDCHAVQKNCNFFHKSIMNSCDELFCTDKTAKNVNMCVSEKVHVPCNKASLSLVLFKEERSLIADVTDIPCKSAYNLATFDVSKDCLDTKDEAVDSHSTKLASTSQSRSSISDSFEMSCSHVTKQHQFDLHGSTASALIEPDSCLLSNCQEQESVACTLGQCETVQLQNCSTFQINSLCIDSVENAEVQQFDETGSEEPSTCITAGSLKTELIVKEQFFTNIKDSETSKPQELIDIEDSDEPKTVSIEESLETELKEYKFTGAKTVDNQKAHSLVTENLETELKEYKFAGAKAVDNQKAHSLVTESLETELKEYKFAGARTEDNQKAHSVVTERELQEYKFAGAKTENNQKAHSLGTESLETELKLESLMSCGAVKSKHKLMPPDLQQFDTNLAVSKVLEMVNRTGKGTDVSDIGNTFDEKKTSEANITLAGNCESLSTLENESIQSNIISVQNQVMKKFPVQVNIYDELPLDRGTSSTESKEEFERVPAVISGSAITGKCLQANVKQSNEGRNTYAALGQSSSQPHSSEKSVDMKTDLFDVSGKNVALSSTEESIKLNATPKRQDNKAKVILNANISLAAFIAERLTKEDLEPSSRMNQAQRVNVIHFDPDSPLDVGKGLQFHQDSPLDFGKRSQFGQGFPLVIGRRSQFSQDIPLCVDGHSQFSQDFPLDVGRHSQFGQNSQLDVGMHSQFSQGSHLDVGRCSQIDQGSLLDIGKCSQIDDSPLDVGCIITEPSSMKCTGVDLEIDRCHSEEVKVFETSHQSSCLVDYSSSESEEEYVPCKQEANDGARSIVDLHACEESESCTNKNSMNVSETKHLGGTTCFNRAKMTIEDEQLEDFRQCKDRKVELEIPSGQVHEAVGHHSNCYLSQGKQLSHEHSVSHGYSKGEEVCVGSEQPGSCEVFESLVENIQCRNWNQSEGCEEIQVAEHNLINKESDVIECADKMLSYQTQVTATCILREADKNLQRNTSLCFASLVGRGQCQNSFSTENIGFVEKVDTTKNINNEGKQIKSGHLDQSTALKAGTANNLDESMACGGSQEHENIPAVCGFQENKTILEEQTESYKERTVINGINLMSEFTLKDLCEVVSSCKLKKNQNQDLSSIVGHCDSGDAQGRVCNVALTARCSKIYRESGADSGLYSICDAGCSGVEETKTFYFHNSNVQEVKLVPSIHTDSVTVKDMDLSLTSPHMCLQDSELTSDSSYNKQSEISEPSEDKNREVQGTATTLSPTIHPSSLAKKQFDKLSTQDCEHENTVGTCSESPAERLNAGFEKKDDSLVVVAKNITSSDLSVAVPEKKVHVNSGQQQSSVFRDNLTLCPGTGNSVVYLCSGSNNSNQDQKWAFLNVSAECDPKEEVPKREVLIAESVGEVVKLHSEVLLNQGESDVLTQTEEHYVNDKIFSSDTDIHKNEGSCSSESQIQISGGSCVISKMAGIIKSDMTTETKQNCSSNSEEKTIQDDATSDNVGGSRSDALDSPSDRRNTDNETDEGDDFSDFDLVIENDTSYRSLSFPLTLEKKNYSPIPLPSLSSYNSKGRISYPLFSSTVPIPSSALVHNRIQDYHASLGQQCTATVKSLQACARNIKTSSQEQFVWDVDDDTDSCKNKLLAEFPTIPWIPSKALKNTCFVNESSSPALESLNRKQKALREKTETAPFTWDLEDFVDNTISNARGCTAMQNSSRSDILSFDTPNLGKRQNIPIGKARRKIAQRKRPLTPDVSHGKMPAKFRRTSSVDRQTKSSSALGDKELKKQQDVGVRCENIYHSLKDPVEKLSNNSITVDEDISFKIDPLSAPLCVMSFDKQSPQTSNLIYTSGHETKLRRGERSQKHFHNSPQLTIVQHDGKCYSPTHVDVVESFRNLPGVRSQHTFMESSKSVTPKRAPEGISQRKLRKSEDPLSPKLKKIGLIKITKQSQSPPSSDSTAPVTRSSEAAIKAFNQKSLRSRGVNPVQPSHSQQTSAARMLPQMIHPKTSPDASSKPKTSIAIQKLSAHIVRNSNTELKTEQYPKSSATKSYHIDHTTVAVVKRRSPTISVTSPMVVHTKTPVALRSRKSLAASSKSHHAAAGSTTIFRVDPLPGTKGTYKSQVIQTAKGLKTLHTPLPFGTSAVGPKKDTSKQPKWKIKKETKLGRGKKQERGPLTFKRT